MSSRPTRSSPQASICASATSPIACAHRLPEVREVVTGAALDIDHAGVALGAVSDQRIGTGPCEIDADRNAPFEVGILGIDQPLARVQRRKLVGIERGMAAAQP